MVKYNFPEFEIMLDIPEDVYFPEEDTYFLLRNLNFGEKIKNIYEIGGGSGIISIVLAKKHRKTRFIVSDISFNAAKMINLNLKLNDISEQIDVVCMDKLNALRISSPEIIIWNPPYLPEDSETQKLPYLDRLMLTGGKRGFESVYELISYLKDSEMKTILYTIFSSIAWKEEDLAEMIQSKINIEIIKELKLPFEKLYLIKIKFGDYDE